MKGKFGRFVNEILFWRRPTEGESDSGQYLELYKRVMRYVRPYLFPQLALAIGAMLLNGSVNGMIPLLIKRIINTIAAIPSTRSSAASIHPMHVLAIEILIVFVARAITD